MRRAGCSFSSLTLMYFFLLGISRSFNMQQVLAASDPMRKPFGPGSAEMNWRPLGSVSMKQLREKMVEDFSRLMRIETVEDYMKFVVKQE